MTSRLPLLQLFNLISPALPVGAFAYSQGQEYAIDAGWIKQSSTLENWLLDVLRYNLSPWDGALLLRMQTSIAENNFSQFEQLNQRLLASRETKELWQEDQQVGLALAKLLGQRQIDKADWLSRCQAPTVASGFAIAAQAYGISSELLLTGYFWSWLENQIAVAGKALPMGQTQAQQLIQDLLPSLDAIVSETMAIADEDIGNTLPGFAMASALHEHQYSRLFRS